MVFISSYFLRETVSETNLTYLSHVTMVRLFQLKYDGSIQNTKYGVFSLKFQRKAYPNSEAIRFCIDILRNIVKVYKKKNTN